jgi:5,10-methylenetetrahydrofolate reductase
MESRKHSKVLEALNLKKTIVSIEVSPPKGASIDKFAAELTKIRDAGVKFINVPDNPRANTRMGSLHVASIIKNKPELGITVIPHFTTRDRNLIALQSDLLGAYASGVSDVLLVTGDPPKLGNNKEATGVYDIDSIGLTYLVNSLNLGQSPGGESLGSGTGYGIGVAANPTALNLELELKRWRYKTESGADFAVTQPIYNPESYLKWLELIGDEARPHLVGIWPFVSLRNAEFMANEVPGVLVPKWAIEEIAKAGDDPAEASKRGIEIACRVIDSIGGRAAGFCISAPLGRIPVALQVAKDSKLI